MIKIETLNQPGYLEVTEQQAIAILKGDLITSKKLGITADQYMSCRSEKWPVDKGSYYYFGYEL